MLLGMLSNLDTKTPIEKFLMGCIDIQNNTKGVSTLSIVQICIMHELATAAKLHASGKVESPQVPLQHIQEKYKLERYTVSRNAIMLGKGGVRGAKGKGWVKPQDGYEDSPDARIKSVALTKKGEDIAAIMF